MAITVPLEVRRPSDDFIRKERRARARRRNGVAALFVVPNLILFAAFLLYPIGWVVRESFMEGGVLGPARWVGVQNWADALQDAALRQAFEQTLVYTAIALPVLMVLALALALALRSIQGRGRATVRAIVYFPSLAPVVLSALVWQFMVHPDFGLFNLVPRTIGAQPVNWLGSEILALPTLAMLDVWRAIGFWALFILAALLAVPAELYQAASLDGARPWRRFLHVTLPGIRGSLTVAVLLATLALLQVFDAVFVLTKGGPSNATNTAAYYIYQSIFESAKPGYGAVLSIMLLAVILVLTGALFAAMRLRRSK